MQHKCPRCSKSGSRDINFYFSKQKVKLEAQVCNTCDYVWAEDEELLKAARKQLYALAKDPNVTKDRKNK